MKRLLWAMVGCLFLTVGVLLVILSLAATLRHNDALPLLMAVAGLAVATFGIFWLKACPFEVLCDTRGLSMGFIFNRRHVAWEHVDWYRYVGFRGTFRAGRSNVWVLLRHRRPARGSSRVMLLLPGTGSAFAMGSRQYITVLDQHISTKRK